MSLVYTPAVLTGLVQSLQGLPDNCLFKMFFGTVDTFLTEEVYFDKESDVMGLAPFVSPLVEGKIMTNVGYETKNFKPAYIKPKRVFEPSKAFTRLAGEPLAGAFTPQDRILQSVSKHLMYDKKSIERRLEWMASSILRTGAVTISGDTYETKNVDFARDAALTVTLTSGNKWGDAGVSPLDSLQDWADLVAQKSGSHPVDVIMEVSGWKKFRSDATVATRLNVQRQLSDMPSMGQGALNRSGLTRVGTIDNFNIWLYEGFYKDSAGAMTRFLPAGTVVLVGDMLGRQAYGAIQDEEAGIQAYSIFSKSWLEKDPGRRFMMSQSAPLLVPYRVNASLCATVL